ncbi:hypothetical protein [Actinoplanes sp. CA-252034]|uniref:ATP dependent DNA ligase n=1 Tax=Actinoplanes sp. CA-252034 TaxID=3239906 RepID=UPI003D958AB5
MRFAGQVGTGFTDLMLRRLPPLGRTTPPVSDVPRVHARHARWVEPTLVGRSRSATGHPDGRLRHPSWRGLRTDRSVSSARRHPDPAVPPATGRVQGAYETPDGRWRVEAARRGRLTVDPRAVPRGEGRPVAALRPEAAYQGHTGWYGYNRPERDRGVRTRYEAVAIVARLGRRRCGC